MTIDKVTLDLDIFATRHANLFIAGKNGNRVFSQCGLQSGLVPKTAFVVKPLHKCYKN